MDVLSDVMTVLRTGRPFASRIALTAPWGHRSAPYANAFGVQIMLRGTAIATTPAGDTFKIEEGDALLVPHGSGITMADSQDSPISPPCEPDEIVNIDGMVIRTDPAQDETATHLAICLYYELASGRGHPMLNSMPDYVHLPADPEARPEVADSIALLDRELQRQRSGADAIVPALLDAVLMYLLRGWLGHRAMQCRFDGWAAALADKSVSAALEAVHADPARQWTVASLGAAAGLSRSAFSRKFTELVGQPPLAYLTSWRLTLAARLLAESDAPLNAVARRVGYASEFAFAAAFKRAFGMPPGKFRKQGPDCKRDRAFAAATAEASP